MIVNIHEAKSTLSKLLLVAESGEEVIIAKAGKPVAYLKPVESAKNNQPGKFSGSIKFANDFNTPLPEDELSQWKG